MCADHPWLTAAEAARVLRVSRATLYAYVSRGYVRSQSKPGSSRERRYSRDDVERLRRRTEERRDPDKAAARVLQWGLREHYAKSAELGYVLDFAGAAAS